MELLQWLWVFEDEEIQPMINQGILQIPKVEAIFDNRVAESVTGIGQSLEPSEFCDISLSFVTYNVMTLRTNQHRHRDGPGLLRTLFKQCREQGIHFLALQETRIQREHLLRDPDYFFFNQIAEKNGEGGTLFAWSRNCHFAIDQKGTKLFLQEEDVSLVYADSQTMIVKVENEYLNFLGINVHSPHTGHSEELISGFWEQLQSRVTPSWSHLPIVLLGDMNARMGGKTSDSVGAFGAEPGTKASECLASFLHQHNLWLPATFENTHKGKHYTWYHPSGHGSRIDHCAIPTSWTSFTIVNEVKEDIGVHGSLFDHQPVQLWIQGKQAARGKRDPWYQKKPGRTGGIPEDSFLQMGFGCAPSCGVPSQVSYPQSQTFCSQTATHLERAPPRGHLGGYRSQNKPEDFFFPLEGCCTDSFSKDFLGGVEEQEMVHTAYPRPQGQGI